MGSGSTVLADREVSEVKALRDNCLSASAAHPMSVNAKASLHFRQVTLRQRYPTFIDFNQELVRRLTEYKSAFRMSNPDNDGAKFRLATSIHI